jgi:cytochrome c oxidase accessory protein FixG
MTTEKHVESAGEVLDRLRPPRGSATIGDAGARKWVYADLITGRFARARNVVYSVLIVFYVLAPWIMIGGHPLLRFDIPGRRYSIFGGVFVATDLYLLALFLLFGVMAMFFFSALLGRLWCGWACPQTVYLEGVFRRIERWIEGTPLQRRKLDSGPHDDGYRAKKLIKHLLFIGISVMLSFSFTAYFVGPQTSFKMLSTFGAGHMAAFITALVLTAAVYWNFSWFREQFCTFLCPYARIQSVMLDDHSLIVGYDPIRGEPRGMMRPDSPTDKGDCIDCKRCVQVCPTGIDIRDGLQMECVSCTACIDACDAVMERIGKPRGLIRYDSLAGLARKPKRVVRARVVLYTGVMVVLLTVLTTRLIGRETLSLTIARSAGMPYLKQEDDRVRNMFILHVTNSSPETETVMISVKGQDHVELLVPGQPLTIRSGERASVEAFVLIPEESIESAETPITLQLNDIRSQTILSEAKTIFLGPVHHGEHDRDHD